MFRLIHFLSSFPSAHTMLSSLRSLSPSSLCLCLLFIWCCSSHPLLLLCPFWCFLLSGSPSFFHHNFCLFCFLSSLNHTLFTLLTDPHISSFTSNYHLMADGQQAQANAMEQLLLQLLQMQQRINELEQRPPLQGAPAIQGQPPTRATAYDFGFSPEQVTTAFRELSDRLRAVSIPASTNINTTKPRGASSAAKAELDTMAKIGTAARTLLQLHALHLREEIPAQQLAEALLTIGLHLTAILQTDKETLH